MTHQKDLRERAQVPTEGMRKQMVDRFLGWKLPENFQPDGGISYTPLKYGTITHQPIGTNLFSATQAKEMVDYMLEGTDMNILISTVYQAGQEDMKRRCLEAVEENSHAGCHECDSYLNTKAAISNLSTDV